MDSSMRTWRRKCWRVWFGSTVLLLIIILIVLVGARARAATDWEIEPVDDPRIALGKISVVGGEIGAEPMNFVLKKITLAMPIQLALVATDEHKPIELAVYKDDAGKPLASGTATSDKE